MPGMDYQPANAAHRAMLDDVAAQGGGALAAEVAALRQEIAALRAELAPVPSLIVTGQQAVAEFQRLSRAIQVPPGARP